MTFFSKQGICSHKYSLLMAFRPQTPDQPTLINQLMKLFICKITKDKLQKIRPMIPKFHDVTGLFFIG